MVNHSYRVLETASKVWRWELASPSGKIVARGAAHTRPKAVARAMLAWLIRLEEQGNARQRDASVVRH